MRRNVFRTSRSAAVLGLVVCWWLVLTMYAPAYGQIHALGLLYSRIWSIIAGGGGTSVGGPYTVTGTIGQPVVGQCGGGSYSLYSGRYAYRPPALSTGDLLGCVYDQFERPMFKAAVTAVDGAGRTSTATTDSSGCFLLRGLRGPSAAVTVQARGYKPAARTISIMPGATVQESFMLYP